MVQFGNPAALWLLTLVVPLLLLYLLKQKRREVTVSSTLLWRKTLEDLRARTPFQRLRSNLLLFLQLLILVLTIAVLSKPYIAASPRPASRMILALDTSASMKATDIKPTRFSAAKTRLLEIVDRAAAGDEIMLVAFSSQSTILHSFSTDHPAVRSRLQRLQPEDVPSNFDQLLTILQPLVRKTPKPAIVIASDFAGFPTGWPAQFSFEPLLLGESGENLAITRAAVEPLVDRPLEQILFLQIQNFGVSTRKAEVQVSVNRQTVDAFEVEVIGGARSERTLTLEISKPSRIDIQLRPVDALQMDNDFVLLAEPKRNIEVNSTIPDRLFNHALSVLPAVRKSKAAGIAIQQTANVPPGVSGLYFLTSTDSRDKANITVSWNETHSSLRFVDAGLWQFTNYSILNPPAGAEVLLETTEGPVAYATAEKQVAQIVFGFSLDDSNLYRMAGFPVFLQNSLEWIDSRMRVPQPVATGPQYAQEGEVQLADGKHAYVNFVDEKESQITPGSVSFRSSAETFSAPARRDLSAWFLIALLAALIVEWWVFHRRIHATV